MGRLPWTCDEELPCTPKLAGLCGDDSARIRRLQQEMADSFRALAPLGKAVSSFGSARTPRAVASTGVARPPLAGALTPER